MAGALATGLIAAAVALWRSTPGRGRWPGPAWAPEVEDAVFELDRAGHPAPAWRLPSRLRWASACRGPLRLAPGRRLTSLSVVSSPSVSRECPHILQRSLIRIA
ncbi:MAG: hypothetical protein WKF82_03825 [Nocardioidaceae bacterium]